MEILNNPTQEFWFDQWCIPLIEHGYIEDLVCHPDVPTFRLFDGLSKPYGKRKNPVMSTVDYTPDRIIIWTEKARGIFFTPFDGANEDWDSCYFKAQRFSRDTSKEFYVSLIEVKGPTGNQKAYNQDFKFTQKWLWEKSQQFVQKVMLSPIKPLKKDLQYLWATTFTPERFLYTDKLNTNRNKSVPWRTIPNKKGVPNWEVRSFEEFIELKNPTIK